MGGPVNSVASPHRAHLALVCAASIVLTACITVVQGPPAPTQIASSSLTPSASPSLPSATGATTSSRRSAAEAAAAATVLIDSPTGHGSGAYVGNARILTAAHVIGGRGPFTIFFRDRLIGSARVDRIDLTDDLATLDVVGLDAAGAVPLTWGDVMLLRLGEPIVVAGYPSQVGFTITQGVFSGLKRDAATEYVQTDAAINPGNSGGPLVNSAGELVGIADWKVFNAQGLGFAVAASTARSFAETGAISAATASVDPVSTAPTLMALYYGYLQARDFYSAWSMLGEDFRAEQPFPTWVAGYSQTLTTKFVPTGTRALSGTTARISGSVVATENFANNPAGFVTQSVYTGYYDIGFVSGAWWVLRGAMELSSRSFVRA